MLLPSIWWFNWGARNYYSCWAKGHVRFVQCNSHPTSSQARFLKSLSCHTAPMLPPRRLVDWTEPYLQLCVTGSQQYGPGLLFATLCNCFAFPILKFHHSLYRVEQAITLVLTTRVPCSPRRLLQWILD